MPRGVALSLQFRILLFTRFRDGFTAAQIFQLVFGGGATLIT